MNFQNLGISVQRIEISKQNFAWRLPQKFNLPLDHFKMIFIQNCCQISQKPFIYKITLMRNTIIASLYSKLLDSQDKKLNHSNLLEHKRFLYDIGNFYKPTMEKLKPNWVFRIK